MKQLIEITPAAQAHIHSLLHASPDKVLLLGVNNKGCNGHSYTFELIPKTDLHKLDAVLDVQGVQVGLENKSLLKLIGSTLDYETDLFGSKFVWHNPAVKNQCGCGESVGF